MRTSLDIIIKFSDTNSKSALRFGSMIDIMQDCMNYQSETLGLGVEYQRRTGRAWILSSWQIEIRGEFDYNEKVTATTWPYYFKGVCGKRNSVIARAAGNKENVVLADSVWAMLDVNKGCLSRLNEEDISLYECEEKLDMEYKKGKIAGAESYEKLEPFVVRKYQLDFNNHMNNGWYVKLAEEFIEDNTRVKRIRVEYRKSAVYGDIVVPYVAREDGRMLVELKSIADERYAVIEFEYK